MEKFIEQKIIDAIKNIIIERVNEIIANYEIFMPNLGFAEFNSGVVPVITLTECETTEKDRIIRLDAYSLTVSLTVPDKEESEIFCFGYNHAFNKAINEYPTLGGIADRVVVTNKKYTPPKALGCGLDWEVVISLRITVEGVNYAS